MLHSIASFSLIEVYFHCMPFQININPIIFHMPTFDLLQMKSKNSSRVIVCLFFAAAHNTNRDIPALSFLSMFGDRRMILSRCDFSCTHTRCWNLIEQVSFAAYRCSGITLCMNTVWGGNKSNYLVMERPGALEFNTVQR